MRDFRILNFKTHFMKASRFSVRSVMFALLAFVVVVAEAKEIVVPKWGRFEQSFTSSTKYENPIQDATLTVILMSPLGETNLTYGFWDGGKTWRVRFSPDMPGKWGWATICSDGSNKGLHLQSGTFLCTASTGKTPLEAHGPVRPSLDGYTLEHADRTPFFWLADTAWNGALLSSSKDWDFYLGERKRQKFTAVQWVTTQWRAAPNGDAQGMVAFSGKEKISVNPEFFRRLDAKADAVNKAGLVNAPVLLWAIAGRSASNNPGAFLPDDQAILLARYMVARWQANDVVWILGGDGHYFGAEGERWRKIGREVFGNMRHAPVAMHPQGRHWIQNEFKGEAWLDIIGYQSGHGDSDESLGWLTQGPLVKNWKAEPRKILINLEPPYEGHLGYNSKKPLNADFVRRAIYWSLLNGPCAGVTYGAHGVWGWDDGTKPPTDHASTGTPLAWRKALRMPGAEQLTNVFNFFTSIDFSHLRPAPEAIVNNPGAQNPRRYIACAKSEQKDLTVVYVPEDRTVEVLLDALPTAPDVKWFNPRTGETTPGVAVITERTAQFPTPNEGDWILWMQTQAKK
jgi:hypothetical protein